MAILYPDDDASWPPTTASPLTCVRRRSGKVWGHIRSIIIDSETRFPVAAMVLVSRPQVIQRVPWRFLVEADNGQGYRLNTGVGQLALMAQESCNTHSILIWHDGMDWLIRKECDGYRTAGLDSDTWTSGPPPGMTEEDLNLWFPS